MMIQGLEQVEMKQCLTAGEVKGLMLLIIVDWNVADRRVTVGWGSGYLT
jgi:hypothetical protein